MAEKYSLRKRKSAPLKDLSDEEINSVVEEPTNSKQKQKKGGASRAGKGKKKKTESPPTEKKEEGPEVKEPEKEKKEEAPEVKEPEKEKKEPVEAEKKEAAEKKEEELKEKKEGSEAPTTTVLSTTVTTKHDETHHTDVLEKGHIYFFYRPKVETKEAHGFEDVQRLYFVMAPEGSEKKRVIAIPKKTLPPLTSHDRYFAFVDFVTDKWHESIDEALGSGEYATKTRGERFMVGARPCGMGVYELVRHQDRHTHLAYVLELPEDIGEVQEAFHIGHEGSYIITVKNPEAPQFAGHKEKLHLPSHLQSKFHGRKFLPADPPELLDYEGMELIIIAAKEDIVTELGLPGEELEKAEKIEVKKLHASDIFKNLHIKKGEHPPQPLITGHWK